MTAEFDRRLNDWFDAVEPRSVPSDILPAVFSQVGRSRQQRAPWHQLAASLDAAWTRRTAIAPANALILVVAILLVAVAAAAVGAGLIRPPAPPAPVEGLIRPTAPPAPVEGLIRPTAPPVLVDGLIAVEDALGDPPHYVIRFIDPRTGDDVFTTPTSATSCGGQFSPDGSHYAFLSRDPSGDFYVSVAPAVSDFQPRKLLLKPIQAHFNPSWAPDGSALVVDMEVEVENGYYTEQWVVPVDGTPAHRLTDLKAIAGEWSPSGEWIAFVGIEGKNPVYIIRPDGSDLRMLRPEGAGAVAWSPVRDELAYSAQDGSVHVITVNGQEVFAAADAFEPPIEDGSVLTTPLPIWSPDGTKIALATNGVVTSMPRTRLVPAITVIDVATGLVQNIVTRPPVARAAWAASGRSLVVVTGAGELQEIPLDGPARLIADGVSGWCMSAGEAFSWQQLRK